MSDTQRKNNPMKPVIAGAALGAAIAAGTVIMSDKKKRKQILDTVNSVKDKTNHLIQQAKEKAHDIRENAEDLREDAEDMLDDANAAKKKLLA